MKRTNRSVVSVVMTVVGVIVMACSIMGTVVGDGALEKEHEKTPTTVDSPVKKTDNTVVLGDVNIRSCPSTACGVVGWLYAGQHVEVSGCLGNWCEVVVEEQEYYIYAPCVGQGKGVCK